jgi:hypothetical protein
MSGEAVAAAADGKLHATITRLQDNNGPVLRRFLKPYPYIVSHISVLQID